MQRPLTWFYPLRQRLFMIISGYGGKSFLALWLFGILLGFSYLIVPGYIFAITLIVCVVSIVAFLRPEYGFYFFVFILIEEMVHFFIVIRPYYEVRIYPYELPLLATGAGLIVAKIAKREALKKTPVTAILLLTAVCEIISNIWAPNREMAFWLSVMLLSGIIIYYVIINVVISENILRTSIKVWIASGVASAGAIIASQWIDKEKTIYFTNNSGIKLAFQELLTRPSGFAGSNHVAGFVSTAFFMTLGSMMYEKRWKVKVIYLLIMPLLLYSVLLTSSRGVIIGLTGAYLFFIAVHDRFKAKFIRYSLIMMISTVFLVLLVKPAFIDRMLIGFGYTGPLLFSGVGSYNGSEADTESGQGLSGMEMRKIWWGNALAEMARHPLKLFFGLGIGGFYYYSQGSGMTVSSPEVNSISFAFFYDIGIFGIILFILLTYLIMSNLYHYLKNAERSYSYYMLLAATTAMIAETGIHGLIDYDLTSYGAKFFWFPLGFAMAVLNIVKDKNTQSVEQIHEMKDITAA